MTSLAVQRAVVLAIAVLAVAWLGVAYRNASRIHTAQLVTQQRNPAPAELEHALSGVRGAGSLEPGSGAEALSYEAALNLRLGRLDAARRLLEELVRREPDSAEAWLLISGLTRKSDPARSAEALAQLRRLDPLGAPPR